MLNSFSFFSKTIKNNAVMEYDLGCCRQHRNLTPSIGMSHRVSLTCVCLRGRQIRQTVGNITPPLPPLLSMFDMYCQMIKYSNNGSVIPIIIIKVCVLQILYYIYIFYTDLQQQCWYHLLI